MKALIIKGKDRHTIRLIEGLKACNFEVDVSEDALSLSSSTYDIVLIDPSSNLNIDKDILTQLSHIIIFFDSEDDPRHFDPGPAYFQYKDIIKAYAKMNWVDNDRNDGIKNIGFPLQIYPQLIQIANIPTDEFSYKNAVPFLVASPTFIGRYKGEPKDKFFSTDDCNSIGVFENGNIMYNQRIDWLLSLRSNNIYHIGGLVFRPDCNLSLEWQSKYFGKGIKNLETRALYYPDMITNMFKYKITLCPTGHERMSWRIFDAMATGSILIATDFKEQKSLIMPKYYITIKDGENIGDCLLNIQKDYRKIWKFHQENREIFKTLTPEKVQELFLKQLD